MAVTLPTVGGDSGEWGDLLNDAITVIDTTATEAKSTADDAKTLANQPKSWDEGITGKPDFATVATTGSYDDLDDKPSIPSTAADVGAATAAQGALADSAVQPADLADVATSGSYSDLTGTPTIPDLPDSDVWSISDTGDTVRNGLTMASVLVLGPSDDIPAETPSGTVILRLDSEPSSGVTFVAASGNTYSGNTTFDLTLPTGSQADDWAIIIGASVNASETVTLPGTSLFADSTGTMYYAISKLQLTSSHISTGSINITASSTTNLGAAMACFRNSGGFGTPGDLGFRTGGEDTTEAPACTASSGQTVVVAALEKSNSPHGVDSVTPTTTLAEFADPGSNTWPSAYIGYYVVAGSPADRTINYSNSSTNPNGVAVQVPILESA